MEDLVLQKITVNVMAEPFIFVFSQVILWMKKNWKLKYFYHLKWSVFYDYLNMFDKILEVLHTI